MKRLMVTVLLLFIFYSFSDPAFAQGVPSLRYVPLPGSKLWLEGSSTINSFSCGTQSVTGVGHIAPDSSPQRIAGSGVLQTRATVKVSIPVGTLDCGNALMNEDMFEAMKAEQFPFIQYVLSEVSTLASSEGQPISFKTIGGLSIAGKTKQVEIHVKAEPLPDGQLRMTGEKVLSMHDFDITPPTAFFGIIKAHDRLAVHFDILVGPENEQCSEFTRLGSTK